jgi:alkyldihydroxyacetonephosphate synthase
VTTASNQAMEEAQTRVTALRSRLPGITIDDSAEVLAELSVDTYWKAKALAAAGRQLLADAVVRPRNAAEVAQTLAAAAEIGIPVVPRAGGSGSQGGAIPDRGGIVLDTSALDRILELDDRSQTVRVEAGVHGLELEEWLNERGYTFPHFPASVHLARVGGYLAAKGSGVLSTKYGKIEDLVMSMEVALASGALIRTLPVPRHSMGPDLNQVFIGSEGTLGVITEATLIVRPKPESRMFRTVAFPDVGTGAEAIRRMLQRGWRPSVVRLHDEAATEANLRRVLGMDVSGVVAVLGFDGMAALVELEEREMVAGLVAEGGTDLGRELAEAWWDNRYKIYYPPFRPELPQIWGTADIVATHDRIVPAYEALRAHFAERYRAYDLRFTGHFSHWYSWGSMVYGRFVVDDPPDELDDALALYDEIWRESSEVVLAAGAVLNDHHGVGLKLAGHVAVQWGAAWRVIEGLKRDLDPTHILNPGKLGL